METISTKVSFIYNKWWVPTFLDKYKCPPIKIIWRVFIPINPSCEYCRKSIAECLPTSFIKQNYIYFQHTYFVFFLPTVVGCICFITLLPTKLKCPHIFLFSFHPRTARGVQQALPDWKANRLSQVSLPPWLNALSLAISKPITLRGPAFQTRARFLQVEASPAVFKRSWTQNVRKMMINNKF